MTEPQTTWETTDDDLENAADLLMMVAEEGNKLAAVLDAIALHQLIQTRRLADAAERQAVALEALTYAPVNTPVPVCQFIVDEWPQLTDAEKEHIGSVVIESISRRAKGHS